MDLEKNEESLSGRNSIERHYAETIVGPSAQNTDEALKNLLERNLALSQEILGLAKYAKSYIRWLKIFSWLKVLIIVIPIVLGIIYLPTALKEVLSSYGLSTEASPYTNLLK